MLRTIAVACLLLGLFEYTAAGPTTKTPAGCGTESFEKCGTDLIIFAGGPVIPVSKEELVTTCPKEKTSEKCARAYAQKCLARFPRGMVMLLLDGIRTEVNAKCNDSGAGHQEYLKHSGCMNSNGVKLHQCMRDLTQVLDQSVDAPTKSRLGLSCCSFNTYKTCMTEAVKSPCGTGTTAYVEKLITGYAGDLLDTVCINFKAGTDACKALPSLPKSTKTGRSASLLSPLARIVTSLNG
ncbi:uncharacterized protein LOC121047798 [Ixodes scapularis]|uniref:uncharacterized protein LOC121047798 n=1 Tax=Ixodes scapularis TaxID=6945 RepID=UPI0011617D46|nr:uncharacterized protein LOC121047798 [Ixodes scapularis]